MTEDFDELEDSKIEDEYEYEDNSLLLNSMVSHANPNNNDHSYLIAPDMLYQAPSSLSTYQQPQQISQSLTHPFTEVATHRHERLKKPLPIPKVVNGYIKFRITPKSPNSNQSPTSSTPASPIGLYNHRSSFGPPAIYTMAARGASGKYDIHPTHVPAGFGRNFYLDQLDSATWNFCKDHPT
jgi:hypothetical protein